MKTKDFIKMLQEEDPSGEAHIRMDGGVPMFAELKPGYWDGPYSYISDEGEYITSSLDNKIDIHCVDKEQFVYDLVDIHEPNNYENIVAKFKFHFSYSIPEQKQERIDSFLKGVKVAFDEHTEMLEGLYKKDLSICLKRQKEGWRFFQSKKVDTTTGARYYYYEWKIIDSSGKSDGSCQADTEPILKSDLFEKIESIEYPEYWEWVFKKK